MIEFQAYGKTPRWNRDIVITEKIDGTNAGIIIEHVPLGPSPEDFWNDSTMTAFVSAQPPGWEHAGDFIVAAQSRKRLIVPGADNFGFASWVSDHAVALVEALGPGRHFGEWWGRGIQHGYGQSAKRFSLFNVHRHAGLEISFGDDETELNVVPTLYQGPMSQLDIDRCVIGLRNGGSWAAPGQKAEGVIVYHSASSQVYKVLLEADEMPKSLRSAA